MPNSFFWHIFARAKLLFIDRQETGKQAENMNMPLAKKRIKQKKKKTGWDRIAKNPLRKIKWVLETIFVSTENIFVCQCDGLS